MSLEKLRIITIQNLRCTCADVLLSKSTLSSEEVEQFDTYWIEAGHRIREQISDDCLLVSLLRHVLPNYKGNPVKLYRGEN